MPAEKIKADLVIIGAGIAGLSLAFRAWQQGLRAVTFDDGRNGATNSATGMIAPRLDYMLKDIELVGESDRQCRQFKNIFTDLITPTKFLIPLGPNLRYGSGPFKYLLETYDRITPNRRIYVPPCSYLSAADLEREEPNIRKAHFDGAFCLLELTTDPHKLLAQLDRFNRIFDPHYRRIRIDKRGLEFKTEGSEITEIKAISLDNNPTTVSGKNKGLIVINASGPWISETAALFGSRLNIELRLGIQISVSGRPFKSGIILLEKNNVFFCLPKNEYTQFGPTNTLFTGHPDDVFAARDGLAELKNSFRNFLDSGIQAGECRFLKAGLRVRPNFGDTNRPIIWSHKSDGLDNFYTLFPGKMSLGLLAADEMLGVISRDGWHKFQNQSSQSKYSLDGNKESRNKLFLKKENLRSLAKVGLSVISQTFSQTKAKKTP